MVHGSWSMISFSKAETSIKTVENFTTSYNVFLNYQTINSGRDISVSRQNLSYH